MHGFKWWLLSGVVAVIAGVMGRVVAIEPAPMQFVAFAVAIAFGVIAGVSFPAESVVGQETAPGLRFRSAAIYATFCFLLSSLQAGCDDRSNSGQPGPRS